MEIRTKRLIYVASITLLLIAISRIVEQDIISQDPRDFMVVYLSTRAWMAGRAPYDPAVIVDEARKVSGTLYQAALHSVIVRVALYPPSCFPLVAPLAALPWKLALRIELVLSAIAYAWMLWLCAMRLNGLKRLYFLSFALAFAPFHSAFSIANLSALAVPTVCAAVLWVDSCWLGAAIFLALATALKPQVAIVFLLHFLLTRRWKPFFTSAGLTGAVFLTSALWMKWHGVAWLMQYRNNLNEMVSPLGNNPNAILLHGAPNFTLFNVQPLAFWFLHDLTAALIVSYVFFFVLLIAYGAITSTTAGRVFPGIQETQLLALAALCTFIAWFQQFYSAVSLLFVILWAVQAWERRLAKGILISAMVFLPPLSKLPAIVRLIRFVLGRTHADITPAVLRAALFRRGLPETMQLTFPELLAYVLPICFVVGSAVCLALDMGLNIFRLRLYRSPDVTGSTRVK
jgi:hypothetical protein